MRYRAVAFSVLLATGALHACSNTPSNVAKPQAAVSHIEWVQCGESQCGTVTVPVNHGITDGPAVKLQVFKRDAMSGKSPDTLVLIPDHTRGYNARELVETAPLLFGSAIRKFNLVAIAPRGTAESPLPEEFKHVVSTHDVAQDIDAVRRSLSVKKIALLAWGTGATAAAEFQLTDPGSVKSAVLDSPWNPLQTVGPQARTAVTVATAGANTAMKWCASHLSCSMNMNVAAMVSQFKTNLRLDRLPSGVDYSTLARAAENALADGNPQDFFAALMAANDGDGVLMLSVAGAPVSSAEAYGHCANVTHAQAAVIAGRYKTWAETKTRQFYIGNYDQIYGLCASLPEASHPLGKIEVDEKAKGAYVLVLHARGDVVIPPKVSAGLAKSMEWNYQSVYANRHLVVAYDRAITAEALAFLGQD